MSRLPNFYKELEKLFGPFPECVTRLNIELNTKYELVTIEYIPNRYDGKIEKKMFKLEEIKEDEIPSTNTEQ